MAAAVPPGCPLSPRQYEIMDLFCAGMSGPEIRAHLVIEDSTLRTHRQEIKYRLGVSEFVQAVVMVMRRWHGWTPPDPPPPPMERVEPVPLAEEHPFLAAYLREFERSRWPHEPDERSARGMRLALEGHRNQKTTKRQTQVRPLGAVRSRPHS